MNYKKHLCEVASQLELKHKNLAFPYVKKRKEMVPFVGEMSFSKNCLSVEFFVKLMLFSFHRRCWFHGYFQRTWSKHPKRPNEPRITMVN